MKGKFTVFEETKNGRRKIGESYNRRVYCGTEFMLDQIYGIESWFSGAAGYDGTLPASGAWNPYRYIAVGYSADDNDGWLQSNNYASSGLGGGGVNDTGGTGISGDVVTTGENIARFPNLEDTYMSSVEPTRLNDNVGTGLFYKLADRTIRSGRTITIEATFTTDALQSNGDSDVIPEGTKIREMGIFLGGHDGGIVPSTGSLAPNNNRSQRPQTMIARSVRYQVSGGYIQDNPITVGANNITFRYEYGDGV